MSQHVLVQASLSITDDLLSPHDLLRLKIGQVDSDPISALVIIDIRSRSRYRRRHIPGSHNIPSGWLLSGEPPEGDLILVGENTAHSALTIQQLHAQGYTRRICHLHGGFPAWQRQELPIASPPLRSLLGPGIERLARTSSALPGRTWHNRRCRA